MPLPRPGFANGMPPPPPWCPTSTGWSGWSRISAPVNDLSEARLAALLTEYDLVKVAMWDGNWTRNIQAPPASQECGAHPDRGSQLPATTASSSSTASRSPSPVASRRATPRTAAAGTKGLWWILGLARKPQAFSAGDDPWWAITILAGCCRATSIQPCTALTVSAIGDDGERIGTGIASCRWRPGWPAALPAGQSSPERRRDEQVPCQRAHGQRTTERRRDLRRPTLDQRPIPAPGRISFTVNGRPLGGGLPSDQGDAHTDKIKRPVRAFFIRGAQRVLPQAQQQILLRARQALMGEGMALFTAGAPAEATGLQNVARKPDPAPC